MTTFENILTAGLILGILDKAVSKPSDTREQVLILKEEEP